MKTKGDAALAATGAVKEYRRQVEELQEERDALTVDLRRLPEDLRTVREQLSAELLPTAHLSQLQQVSRLIGTELLLVRRRQFETHRGTWSERLIAVAQEPDYLQRESLLEPENGVLGWGLRAAQGRQEEILTTLDRFDNDTFRWLQNQQEHKADGGFHSFFRALTFASHREQSARKRLLKGSSYSSWDELQGDYDRCTDALPGAMGQVTELQLRHDRLRDLMAEHDDLHQWVHRFEERLTEELRTDLSKHLSGCDPADLLTRLPTPLKGLAARMHALGHQELYLRQLELALANESLDRKNQAAAIQKTQLLWERRKWDRLPSDKSNWLIRLPAAKSETTAKRLRWSRSLHRNVAHYSDWDDYSLYLESGEPFLPYDAFGWASDDPMPYEGFSRKVLPDLDRHRRDHALEKADYSLFKRLDKRGRVAPVVEEAESEPPDNLLLTEAVVATAVVVGTAGIVQKARTERFYDPS